jgi:hypothetical protein
MQGADKAKCSRLRDKKWVKGMSRRPTVCRLASWVIVEAKQPFSVLGWWRSGSAYDSNVTKYLDRAVRGSTPCRLRLFGSETLVQ